MRRAHKVGKGVLMRHREMLCLKKGRQRFPMLTIDDEKTSIMC